MMFLLKRQDKFFAGYRVLGTPSQVYPIWDDVSCTLYSTQELAEIARKELLDQGWDVEIYSVKLEKVIE